MDIPEYLKVGVPTFTKPKTIEEIGCEMRERIGFLERENRELLEARIERDREMMRLKESLERLEGLYKSVSEGAVGQVSGVNSADKKKPPSQYGDLEEQKKKLERVSKTLEKIRNRQMSLKKPIQINLP